MDLKLCQYSVNTSEQEQFCSDPDQTDPVQCKRKQTGAALWRIKSDPVQCKPKQKGAALWRIKNDPVQCKRRQKGIKIV